MLSDPQWAMRPINISPITWDKTLWVTEGPIGEDGLPEEFEGLEEELR